jgi:hypothetical protein
LGQTGPSPERPAWPASGTKHRVPPRSEIARISWGYTKGEITVERKLSRTFVKVAETQEVTLFQFAAEAVGPEGRYVAGASPGFRGSMAQRVRSRWVADEYIARHPEAEAALNALLSQLWSEGWQPTSWGQFWYEFRLRRVVTRARRSSSGAPAPAAEVFDA